MAPYDVAMVAIVVAGMIWGAWRGITWQLASILSLGLGYAVAVPTSAQIAPHFPGQPIVARTLALLGLYMAVSATVFAVAWSIRATLRKWKFEAYDRHLGMLLGALEGASLGIIATVIIISLAPQTRSPILTSKAGRIVEQGLYVVKPALPKEIQKMLATFSESSDGNDPIFEEPVDQLAAKDESSSEASLGSWFSGSDDAKTDGQVLQSAFERGSAEAGRAIAEEFQGGWGREANQADERNSPRR